MSIKGFKGFDKEFKCRDYQYEVGKEYETNKAKACESGFHFCENPLDVFRYYPPSTSRFAEVEGGGKTDTHKEDSKVACTQIKVGAEIGLGGIVTAGIKYILNNADSAAATNTGDQSAATNTGDQSAATNTGDQSAATNTGYRSAAVVEGQQSIACGLGVQNKSKGKKSCWLVLSEWAQDENGSWVINTVKSIKVDGRRIKENTFYMLKNGKFVRADQ